MCQLIIDNHVILKDIDAILSKLKSQIPNGKLKDIKHKGDNILLTCPHHKEGLENNPSCTLYIGDSELPWGTVHCFTCGFNTNLAGFVGECFDRSEYFGKEWLKKNFTETVLESSCIIDEPIILKNQKKKKVNKNLDESLLDTFQSWHPYMQKRKLSKEVCNRFKIKYDPETESIVFPVWDAVGNLKFLTRRSVEGKTFIIDKDAEKEVYLLNTILNNNIKEIYVVESQINCLTLWSYGYPAVALFGTGSSGQYEIFNKSGIISYHLCLDGDNAGRKGTRNFINNVKGFIDVVDIPEGKDVNDLTKDEFEKLNILNSQDWLNKNV